MALEGTFRDFHIADILQLIGLQHKTGTLTLEGEEDTLTVSFQDGAVAWAQSTRLPWDQRMAQVLVSRGLITPTQLQEALTLQRDSKKKLSSILPELGNLQKKDWDSLLAREVEEAVYRPFRWTSGRYRFVSQPSVDLAEGKITPLSTESVLMEGVRRLDEWPMIREKVPSPAMVFKVGTQPGRLNPKQVEPNEVKMLDLVDGKRTVQELVDASGLGEFEAMRGLASLVSAGAIAAIGPVTAPPSVEAPAVRVTPSLPARPPSGPHPWVARVAWGVAAVWLVVSLPLFRAEPLGLFPLSAARTASLDRVRSLRAQADLVELARDVERFAVMTGEYPRGLEMLGTAGRPIADPWGHPYQIRRSETGVSVISAGPDGRTGTTDDVTITGA
jgi:Domain of unknown function (DUF4388)/Type II secretion system (T2SS), protein G